MNNRTFHKCLKCDKIWITERSEIVPHLSKEYYDISTKEKPFIKECRKCVVKSRMEEINKKIEDMEED